MSKNKDFPFVLKLALALNFSMFIIEITFGLYANSLALIFDATDFLGDSLNYGIAIYVLSKPQIWKSLAATIKAAFMLSFGIYILANGIYRINIVEIPSANTMIWVAALAMVVNLAVSLMLFKFRKGDSNQKSVWLCSRNDTINNLLVIIAGFLVGYFNSKWPDLIVAGIMSFLAISSAFIVFKEVKKELKFLK